MTALFLIFSLFISACSTLPTIRTQRNNSYPLHQNSNPTVKVTKKPDLVQAIENKPIVESIPQETVSKQNELKNTSVNLVLTQKEEIIEKIYSDKNYPTDSRKVGVILPLSGKNAALGQRALASIRLGIDSTNSQISLALYDSQGSPELAAAGVEKLLKDDQVIALLGGLGGKEALAISVKAEFFRVPFFTFSQKSDLTSKSEYTFRNAVTAAMQTSQLVDYAVQKLGMKKFAILYPNDAYGVEFANHFWDQVLAYGGQITAAQIYNPKDVDLTIPIQKLVGTYYLDSRMDDYKKKIEAQNLKKKQNLNVKKKSVRESETAENKLDPIVDFDALFIPDSSKILGQTIGFLKAADVDQLVYLGTNLWNTDELSRRTQQQNNQKNQFYFVDHFITDEQRKNSSFNVSFIAAFNEAPSIIETQTYESAKIFKELILNNATTRQSLTSQLKSLGRNKGAYNEIYMNNAQEISRDLTIFHLENGLIVPQ